MKFITDSNILSQLNQWGGEFVTRLKAELWNQSVTASGRLADSLEYEITDDSDGTHIRVLGDYYFPYAEAGRKAGKIPYNFASIVEKWVEDKGVSVPSKFKTPRQFAWAIAYKIKYYGSRRYREQDIADVVSPVADEMIPRLNDIVTNSVVVYVNDNIF